jgi:Fe2+ or Zn2+ uptake regulation protein
VTSAVDQDVREKLRHSGYTLTSQRRAVLDALAYSEGHPSAEDVYLLVKRRNPRVALGTVYQALSVLEEVGIIESKRWSDSPTRYDLNTEPHTDIRCTRCGAVDEVPGVEYGGLAATVRANTSYRVTDVSLVIEGVCPACQRAS